MRWIILYSLLLFYLLHFFFKVRFPRSVEFLHTFWLTDFFVSLLWCNLLLNSDTITIQCVSLFNAIFLITMAIIRVTWQTIFHSASHCLFLFCLWGATFLLNPHLYSPMLQAYWSKLFKSYKKSWKSYYPKIKSVFDFKIIIKNEKNTTIEKNIFSKKKKKTKSEKYLIIRNK